MAPTPEISVIVPAYNAARTVGTAVDSVLAQSFTDVELIVIDDGSRDDTAVVIGDRDDPRLILVSTENWGVAAARNRGLEVARGSYVAFLDADDVWLRPKLERQHVAMSKNAVGLSFVSAQVVDDDLCPIGIDSAVDRSDYTEALLVEGNIIAGSASSVMARRELIDEVGGFDPHLSQCADWDLWLRMSVVTSFLPLHEPLALYRGVPGTMSSDPELLERDTFALLDKFFAGSESLAYEPVRKRAYANHSMICAGSYLHAGCLRDSLRCAVSGLRSDPRTAGRLAALPARWADRARRGLRARHGGDRSAVSRRT